MSLINNNKMKVQGYISAIRTMLDNYPELKINNSPLMDMLNSNTPFGFLMNLLVICGVDTTKLLNWCAKVLCGSEVLMTENYEKTGERLKNNKTSKVDQGILDTIEYAIKALLLANVKDLFTCSLNPFIPQEVVKYPTNLTDGENLNGKGIEIPIATIDMYNVLVHAPTSKYGKSLYFDNNHSPNDLWKSTDFNAFLWYTINKGDDHLKCIWDNRCRPNVKKLIYNNYTGDRSNTVFTKNFFNTNAGDGFLVDTTTAQTITSYTSYNRSEIKDNKDKIKKKSLIKKQQYIIVEYEENSSVGSVPDVLKFYLNGDRYRYKVKGTNTFMPKTVFEFNYDYIFSLKLFDSKTLVAHVVNSLLGILNSATASVLNSKLSLDRKMIECKVGEVITELMNSEDYINDCSFSFSNDEYERLMRKSELKQSQGFEFGTVQGKLNQEDIDNLLNDINSIGDSATLEEEQTKISNLFETAISATKSVGGGEEIDLKWSLNANIIIQLLKMTITEIVMQVLSPKVMVLYALNSYFMGDSADFKGVNIENFLKGLTNLITKIVKQVFEIIMKELMKFLLEQLLELLQLMAEKLILEKLQFWIELIKRLLALLQMFGNMFIGLLNKFRTNDMHVIDNVNYADIIPPNEQTTPKNDKC